jgi:hypothetical protein
MKATKADRETRRRDDRRRDRERRQPDRHDRATRGAGRRSAEPLPSTGRAPRAKGPEAREKRPAGSGPQTTPIRRQARPTSTTQAKARAKARKAKAPKPVRRPLRERLIIKLASIDLRPRTLAGKVPFVVLIIGSLGLGLGATLWLSTYSAERSYQLGNARQSDRALTQQKEALERDVLEAQSAPALAEAARNLGMIPSRDTAHLVQDPSGNWIVVGKPTPAEGAPPPPLNTPLPDPTPPPPPPPPNHPEVPVLISPPAAPLAEAGAPGAVAPGPLGATPPVGGAAPPVAVPAPPAGPAPPAEGVTPPAAGATPPGAAPETLVRLPSADAGAGPPPVAAPGQAPAAPAPAPVPAGPAPAPVAAPAQGPPPDAPQPANAPTAPAGGEQLTGVAPPTAVPQT